MGNKSRIEEKIKRLIEWKKKYPQITFSNSRIPKELIKNYSISEEEYIKMHNLYEYVKQRMAMGKLTEEQKNRCKEANLGGAFGYSSKIEKLAQKYKQKNIDINYIITNYGTIEKFILRFEKGKIPQKDLNFARKVLRNTFDIDNNTNNKFYEELIIDIFNPSKKTSTMYLYSSRELDHKLKQLATNELTKNELTVINERYGLKTGKPKTLEAIRELFNVERERIRQIEANGLKKLQKTKNIKKLEFEYKELSKEEYEFLSDEDRKKYEKLKKQVYVDCRIIPQYDKEETEKKNLDKVNEYVGFVKTIKERFKIEREKNIQEYLIEKKLNREISIKAELAQLENWESTGVFEKWEKSKKVNDPIELIGFSVRTSNGLSKEGIRTIQELILYKKEDLFKIRNLGEKSVEEIITKLKVLGISNENDSENYKQEGQEAYKKVMMQSFLEWRKLRINKLNNELNFLQKIDSNLYDLDLSKLNFSVRTHNALFKAGYKKLGDIIQLDEQEIKEIRSLGEKGSQEIFDKFDGIINNNYENFYDSGTNNKSGKKLEDISTQELNENQNYSQLEFARQKRDELKKYLEELEGKIPKVKELILEYDKLLGEDKEKQKI